MIQQFKPKFVHASIIHLMKFYNTSKIHQFVKNIHLDRTELDFTIVLTSQVAYRAFSKGKYE